MRYHDVSSYIGAKGVTRCPTASAARSSGRPSTDDQEALRARTPPTVYKGGSPAYFQALERRAVQAAEQHRVAVEEILALPHVKAYYTLARELNERQIPTPLGGKWQHVTVERLLGRLNLTFRS